MKKQLVVAGVTIMLLVIGLSGCITNNEKELVTTPEPKKIPLDTVSLKLDDLPFGYIKLTEDFNFSFGINQFIKPAEVYGVTFVFEDPVNNTGFPIVALTLAKFNSSDDAERAMLNSSKQMSTTLDEFLNCSISRNIEQMGNNSIYKLFEGSMGEDYNYQNATWSFVYFRIENIVAFLLLDEIPTSEIDYVNLTINYAEIVEERIIMDLQRI